ncbi:MAG: LPXTG cell wall anchor domain-containing protein [Clostridia bacterium]|nr:LPXTG cell wall anchor domain-containing protein [Clostridia bacterium]
MKKAKIFLSAMLFSLWQTLMTVAPASAQTLLTSPQTGDNSYLILMVGAAVCVLLIVIVIAMGKRRK